VARGPFGLNGSFHPYIVFADTDHDDRGENQDVQANAELLERTDAEGGPEDYQGEAG
jgi:hypothetical protein